MMMGLALFTKVLSHLSIDELIDVAPRIGAEAYNLCVRDGNPVTPGNAVIELPRAARRLAAAGVPVEYVTGPGDMTNPGDGLAEGLVGAAGDAGIGLVKLGYFTYSTTSGVSYAELVDDIRRRLEGWQRVGERYGVRLCYHTHGNAARHRYTIGGSAAELERWMEHIDPRYIGMNLDAGCLLSQGEPFELAVAIAAERLAAVSLQDEHYQWRKACKEDGPARSQAKAGQGAVCWRHVFEDLAAVGYTGPLIVHGEMPVADDEDLEQALRVEIEYFKRRRSDTAERSGT